MSADTTRTKATEIEACTPVRLRQIVDAIPAGATSAEAIAHIDEAMKTACRRHERWALDYMADLMGAGYQHAYPLWLNDEVPG